MGSEFFLLILAFYLGHHLIHKLRKAGFQQGLVDFLI